MAERVADFKRDVAPGLPEFYGVERYNGRLTQADRDREIERAIKTFPEIRDAYAQGEAV